MTSITEITGMEGDVITMQEIFTFDRQGIGEDGRVLGRFKPTGIRPRFAERLQTAGIEVDAALFADVESVPGAGRWSR